MAFNFNFNANVASAINGVKQLQATIVALGQNLQTANTYYTNFFNNTQLGAQTMPNGDPFKAIDNSTLRVIDRMARFLTAISGVKKSLDELFGVGSGLSKVFEALGEGTRVFVNLAQLAKDNLGLFAAGVVGLAAAVIMFTTAWVQAKIKSQEAVTDQAVKTQKAVDAYRNSMEDAAKTAVLFNKTTGEQAAQALSMSSAAYEKNLQRLRDLEAERKKAFDLAEAMAGKEEKTHDFLNWLGFDNEGRTVPPAPQSKELEDLREKVRLIDKEVINLKLDQEDIQHRAAFLVLADQVGKYSTALRDANLKLRELNAVRLGELELAQKLQPLAKFGADLPEAQRIKSAQDELALRTKIYTETVAQQDAVSQQISALYALTNRSSDENKKLEDLLVELKSSPDTVATALNNVVDAFKKLRVQEAPIEFTNAFTKPFTEAISTALVDGIVNAQKGAEILANISKNLFTAALNDVMKRFQQGMIDVFKSIAGAGGELLGSALLTVVGVVAGVLGRRASSTDKFDTIANQITSTEAVRGIVSGPANVAIAAVGQNLKIALLGTEQRLDIIINVLQRAVANGASLAGTVATP